MLAGLAIFSLAFYLIQAEQLNPKIENFLLIIFICIRHSLQLCKFLSLIKKHKSAKVIIKIFFVFCI